MATVPIALVAVALVLFLPTVASGSDNRLAMAAELSSRLRGTWVSVGDGPARVLLIRGIAPLSAHALEVEAFAGFDGWPLNPVIELELDPVVPRLTFKAPDGAAITIGTADPRSMEGRITVAGSEAPIGFLRRSSTPWSSRQAAYRTTPPGRAVGGQTASLPDDARVSPADPSLPVELQRFSGAWDGWCGPQAPRSVKVVVESINSTGGTIAYANGGYGVAVFGAFGTRLSVNYIDGELVGAVPPGGGTVALRIRNDGHMDFINYWDHKRGCYGLLKRQ